MLKQSKERVNTLNFLINIAALEINKGNTDYYPELFELTIRKTPPLTSRVIEVDERLDAAGNVLDRLDEQQVREQLKQIKSLGVRSLAICLLHAYVNDVHEIEVERIEKRPAKLMWSISSTTFFFLENVETK